jgi:signal transduction histidine kinase
MRILIADDDATTRLMLQGVLSRLGYDVNEAGDGTEAWAQLTVADPPRMAIIDWMMPGMTGPELCRKLKARDRKNAPYIILFTARGRQKDVVDGLDAGADDFMSKPCDIEELRARLNVGRRIIQLQHDLLGVNAQLERRVEERTRQVEAMLQTKEALLQHLSHDLKTPLTPLLALLPLLCESEPDAERRQMLEMALSSTRSIQRLTGQVLELCRVEANTPAMCPGGVGLHDLVNGVFEQCRYVHAIENRALLNEVPAGCRVQGDPHLLHQVFCHLLSNAIKFTSPQGQITVRASAREGSVFVAVADDGMGMETSHLQHIFEAFYKADPSRHLHGAPGLGLTMARIIIEQHGGRIWAESSGPGTGATICFCLPAVPSIPGNEEHL